MEKAISVETYIANYPDDIARRLKQIRAAIKKNAPQSEESISYGMPAYKQNGVLVYFAAFKNHIGFYPTASGIKAFEKQLKDYSHSKGAVQFPHDKPLPLALVEKMVKFRVKENMTKKKSS